MNCLLIGLTMLIANPTDPLAAQGTPTALRLTREMRIDGNAMNLVSPGWLLPLRDGRIAISQTQDRMILFFDSAGRAVGRFGRQGQGPGEFGSLGASGTAGLVGDSLWIRDAMGRRTTIVSPSLTFVRDFSDRGAHPAPGGGLSFPNASQSLTFGVYGDGTLLVQPTLQQTQEVPAGYDRTRFNLVRVGEDGIVRRRIAQFEYETGQISIGRGSGSFASWATPSFARTTIGVSSNGNHIVSLSCVYDGPRARTILLTAISANGDTVYSRNYPFTVYPIPSARRDSLKDAAVQAARASRGANAAELAAEVRAKMTVPSFYAPFVNGGLSVGDDGTTWIGLRAGEAAGIASFMVIDRAGNVTGVLPAPANTRVMAVSATHMWGVEQDQNDLPSIVRYRVSR